MSDLMRAESLGWYQRGLAVLVLLVAGGLAGCRFDPELSSSASGDAEVPAGGRDGASPGHCTGVCQGCIGLSEQSCDRVQGCRYVTQAGCGGSCWDCGSFVDSEGCRAQAGCDWAETQLCTGHCEACSELAEESICVQQQGCSWQPGACEDAPGALSCGSLTRAGDCRSQPGCEWHEGRCTGGKITCGQMGPILCALVAGCSWDVLHCVGSGSLGCEDIQREDWCKDSRVCTWDSTPYCDGEAQPCGLRTEEASCVLGCAWRPGVCSGQCRQCSAFQQSDACADQRGCRWTVSAHCSGTCEDCRTIDEAQCDAQAGCQWADQAGCVGECVPCDALRDEASCRAQPGCRWE